MPSIRASLYLGCTVATDEYAYELSTINTLPKLGVELEYLEGASCCGSPLKSISARSFAYLSARNLSLASAAGPDLLTLCPGCHLSFCEVAHYVKLSPQLKDELNSQLSLEGLRYEGEVRVWHVVDLLHDGLGLDRVRSAVSRPLRGLRLATHVGCHAIRPSRLPRVDDPERPTKLDRLVEALGAEVVDYPEKLDCCGAGFLLCNPQAGLTVAGLKVRALQALGIDGLVVACPLCHKMLGQKQQSAGQALGAELNLPVVYYTQLLGLAMGEGERSLGLMLNQSPVERILEKLK
ncbi:MAG: CoB--CoM heterodisulfide reductase iron-sulfur subunit B family protein [Candidatus Nezhaarchaeales archaeon]